MVDLVRSLTIRSLWEYCHVSEKELIYCVSRQLLGIGKTAFVDSLKIWYGKNVVSVSVGPCVGVLLGKVTAGIGTCGLNKHVVEI